MVAITRPGRLDTRFRPIGREDHGILAWSGIRFQPIGALVVIMAMTAMIIMAVMGAIMVIVAMVIVVNLITLRLMTITIIVNPIIIMTIIATVTAVAVRRLV